MFSETRTPVPDDLKGAATFDAALAGTYRSGCRRTHQPEFTHSTTPGVLPITLFISVSALS